jgi:hypothetical protein
MLSARRPYTTIDQNLPRTEAPEISPLGRDPSGVLRAAPQRPMHSGQSVYS